MKHPLLLILAASALAVSVSTASAMPILYSGHLNNAAPQAGATNQGRSNPFTPAGAVYYSFAATAGMPFTISGNRLDGDFDMAFWIFKGVFGDTAAFGAVFTPWSPGFTAYGDDEQPAYVPGPFGDPLVHVAAPATGLYTVAVTNWASSGSGPYRFQLTAHGVPEPSALALLGIGLLGLAVARRSSHA